MRDSHVFTLGLPIMRCLSVEPGADLGIQMFSWRKADSSEFRFVTLLHEPLYSNTDPCTSMTTIPSVLEY